MINNMSIRATVRNGYTLERVMTAANVFRRIKNWCMVRFHARCLFKNTSQKEIYVISDSKVIAVAKTHTLKINITQE